MMQKPYQPPLYTSIKKTFLFLVLLSGLVEPVKGQTTRSDTESYKEKKQFANPALIYGTDFLRMFQQFYMQADWEMMILFTSRESINRIGQKRLVAYYKQMKFGYFLKLYSMNKENNQFTLNYCAKLNATEQIIRCIVSVQNDTCRIVLPDNVLYSQTFLFK